MRVRVNDYCLTPNEPHGLVRVLEIYPEDPNDPRTFPRALVEYLHFYQGYTAGQTNTYILYKLHSVVPELVELLKE